MLFKVSAFRWVEDTDQCGEVFEALSEAEACRAQAEASGYFAEVVEVVEDEE